MRKKSASALLKAKLFKFEAADGNAYIWSVDGPDVDESESCERCGRPMPRLRFGPAICAEVEGPPRWADWMECTDGDMLPIVAVRVARAMKRAGITGFRDHPVKLADIALDEADDGKRPPKPPTYRYLEITGRIDLDLSRSGVKARELCATCFQAKDRTQPKRFVPSVTTWDGSDLIMLRNYPSAFTFCSEKLARLARKERWTGFRIEPVTAG